MELDGEGRTPEANHLPLALALHEVGHGIVLLHALDVWRQHLVDEGRKDNVTSVFFNDISLNKSRREAPKFLFNVFFNDTFGREAAAFF